MPTLKSQIAYPFLALVLALPSGPAVRSQTPGSGTQTATPRQSGTIKAVTPRDFVLTSTAGQDFAVTVPPTARILLVDPATRDIKTAQSGTMADVAGGDKAIVTGTPGDAGQMLTATRVLLLKSGAIAAMHQQEQAAWARSVGGLVKAVDPATGVITAVNGTRSYTINTSASTLVRRYASGSVRFEDAVKSSVDAIKPGDQVQAHGQRSPDGLTVTADEIVTGSFINVSGILTAVDATAGTVTLKDLATKRTVTVAITGQTNLRKLPAGFGQAGAPGTGAAAPASQPVAGQAGLAGQGAARAGAGRMDLSRVVNRLPTETVADLKAGDAVIVVASNNQNSGQPTAITMVSGVDQILAASPAGQTTLSPWSLGSGQAEGDAAGGGGAGGPGGR